MNKKSINQILNNNNDIVKMALSYVFHNNESNDAPYHNLNHLLTVFKFASHGCDFHRIRSQDVLIAALFHDFNHLKGKAKSDSENIHFAIEGFKKWRGSNSLNSSINEDKVVKIILATEYPYTIPESELFLEQRIIRDADMMQILNDDWVSNVIFGLAEEMNVQPLAMLELQLEFHKKLHMHSKFGRKIKKKYWPEVIEKIKTLREVL